MNDKLYVTNADGVVVDEIESIDKYVKLSDGDKVIRKGVLQYLNDTTDIRYRFVKINHKIFDKYCKKYSILPTLVCHIGFMDNICEFSNGKRITMKNIPDLCNVSESTAKRQINGMIADDLLHKVKDGKKKCFMMNPWLCTRGKKIYLSTYEEFKLSALRSECEEWSK